MVCYSTPPVYIHSVWADSVTGDCRCAHARWNWSWGAKKVLVKILSYAFVIKNAIFEYLPKLLKISPYCWLFECHCSMELTTRETICRLRLLIAWEALSITGCCSMLMIVRVSLEATSWLPGKLSITWGYSIELTAKCGRSSWWDNLANGPGIIPPISCSCLYSECESACT